MALKFRLTKDEHAKLPAHFQAEYAEKDGAFVLQVDAVEDAAELKASLSAERELRRKADARLAAIGDLDPDKAREALAKVEKMSKWTPEEKVQEQIKAQLEQMNAKHQGELQSKIEREKKLEAAVRRLVVDSEVQRVLAGKGSARLLLPAIRDRIRVDEEGDQFKAVVLDDKGNPKLASKAGSTDYMGIEEFVMSLRSDPELSHAFFGSGHSGTGATGRAGGGSGGPSFTLTSEQARDRALYKRTEDAAKAAGAQVQIVD